MGESSDKDRVVPIHDKLDLLLWKRLREADPGEIGRNALVGYDAARRGHIVPFLDREFIVLPWEDRIEPLSPAPEPPLEAESVRTISLETKSVGIGSAPEAPPAPPSFEFYLCVLHYLLEAKPDPPSGKWISEKELPGGVFFFRGPHALPTRYLLDHFGSRPEALRAAAEMLGGVPAEGGDMAFRFQVLPRIPMLFVFREGDDEFGPDLRILFDAGIGRHIAALDTLWAVVKVVAKKLARGRASS